FLHCFSCSAAMLLLLFFFFNGPATTEIYTLSLHDALPILVSADFAAVYATISGLWRRVECAETFTIRAQAAFRNSGSAVRTVRRSEEHTSELQSRSDLVCRLLLEKKKNNKNKKQKETEHKQ